MVVRLLTAVADMNKEYRVYVSVDWDVGVERWG